MVTRRGDSDAGAIFIKINLLDGRAILCGPAPAGMTDEDGGRLWCLVLGSDAAPEGDVDAYLERQAGFDSDFWVVEVENSDGLSFLDDELLPP